MKVFTNVIAMIELSLSDLCSKSAVRLLFRILATRLALLKLEAMQKRRNMIQYYGSCYYFLVLHLL
jgi:hypothetical protein